MRPYPHSPSEPRQRRTTTAPQPEVSCGRATQTPVEEQLVTAASTGNLGEPSPLPPTPNVTSNSNMALVSQFMTQMCQFINTIASSATPGVVVPNSSNVAPSGQTPFVSVPTGGDISGNNTTVPFINATTGMAALPNNNVSTSNVQHNTGISTVTPATVWSNSNDLITPDIPCFDRRAEVAESCLKEAMRPARFPPWGFTYHPI